MDTTTSTTTNTGTGPTTGHHAEARVVGVATGLREVLDALLGTPVPVRLEFWDGSGVGPVDGPGTLHVRSPEALRRILWAPGELGLARAFVTGDLDAEGDVIELLTAIRHRSPRDQPLLRSAPAAMAAARRYGVLARPLPPPNIEYQPPRGRAHTRARDAETVGHHYDVSNRFYAVVLGPSMTYSCALFAEPGADLGSAQAAKHDRVCRKLGLDLAPGSHLLDVGCGWGSMAIHAAQHHGARVVGITISAEQAAMARERVEAAGVSDQVEIRLQDYRDLGGEVFDAISSIGMFEHVGRSRLAAYFTTLRELLRPQGRLLNHAISSVGGSKMPKRSFVYRYVFPDGELIDVGETVLAMERAGFEVRDVESLREHYAITLRHWVANLERHWDAAVADVGEQRARAWRLYMAASSVGFTDGGINLHQVLGVVPDASGASAMPTVRPF
ncbi:cyclopropane-fatty-acyl-phospholipid synthase family protein [soil metagenome]